MWFQAFRFILPTKALCNAISVSDCLILFVKHYVYFIVLLCNVAFKGDISCKIHFFSP